MDLVKSSETSPSKSNGVKQTEDDDATKASIKGQKKGCFAKDGCIRMNLLTILTLLSVILGIGLGFILRASKEQKWTKRDVMYLSFPGDIFLRMLKCLILPLIVSSLVSAIGNMDTKLSGRIGTRAVTYYLGTTVLAIILGIILVTAIRPGVGHNLDDGSKESEGRKSSFTSDTLLDLLRNVFPPNIMEATIYQTSTHLVEPKNISTHWNESDPYFWDFQTKLERGTNILGLVVFSLVLGIVLAKMNEKGKPLLYIFTSLSDAMMIITKGVIWLSPIGVMFLIAGKIVEMDDLSQVAGQVGLYTATVLAGLFIHALITLSVIYMIFIRNHPFYFIANMAQAIATAFGTSSSSATLPVTITCLEDKNKVDPRVARFCLPIGATINMDGTALYEAVAAIFIAQVRNVPLTVGNVIGISITATAASIGAAGIPQAGLVTMVMVLNVVGLPAEDVTLIFVVDWLLDRFRTAVNVLGDAIGAAVVAHLSSKDLEKLDHNDGNSPSTRLEMTSL